MSDDPAEFEASLRAAAIRAGISLAPIYYVLEGETIRAVDMPAFVLWQERHEADRRIAKTEIRPGLKVSTVFLGINHNFSRIGPPIVFETMVFGGLLDQEMDRYATIAEARAGHEAMVARVRRAEGGESI